MRALVFSLLLCFLFISQCINGQSPVSKIDFSEPKPETIWGMLKYDTEYTFKSVSYAVTRPLYWQGNDFAKLGILLGSTVALTFTDESIREFAQNQSEDFPQVIRDFGWYFGSPQNYFMANAGLYGFGLFTKNENLRRVSVLIISSSLTTGFIQSFCKGLVGRARPGTEVGHLSFKPFSNDPGYRSFPSGHTVLSITMAHSIALQFDNPWIKASIYAVGAIPPISRIIDDAHWLSDVVFSTVLSIFVVNAIDKFLFGSEAYEGRKKDKAISWNFRIGTNQIGFVGTF